MRWLGIDVGGANIKLSDGDSFASSTPFELWRNRDGLSDEIAKRFDSATAVDAIAATMTGELADCYQTKDEGVRHIAHSLAQAAGERRLYIYGVDGCFHTTDALQADPQVAAASNWHALARMAARWLPRKTGLVIDIGSTTADIIPVKAGCVVTSSQSDADRLLAGELVYTGVARTPLCAVVDRLPYRSADCPVAAELFATTADVYQVLGEADASDFGTADGRDATLQFCVDRLSRQVCADRDSFTLGDARRVSRRVKQRQIEMLSAAVSRALQALGHSTSAAIVSGSGEWLAHEMATQHPSIEKVISLSEAIGTEQSSCAAAAAVARLAGEELG